jgi:hypothetical protein
MKVIPYFPLPVSSLLDSDLLKENLGKRDKAVPVHTMKAYGGVEVHFHQFLTSYLHSRVAVLQGPNNSGMRLIGDLVGPTACLGLSGEKIIPFTHLHSNPGPSSP